MEHVCASGEKKHLIYWAQEIVDNGISGGATMKLNYFVIQKFLKCAYYKLVVNIEKKL